MSHSPAMSRHCVANASTRKSSRVKKNGVRLQYMHNGLTQRPTILKEGYLYKPSFFRFGGRRRRWCVLRTYSPTEASMDIFVDETKTRYKGTIVLDKEIQPVIVVKTPEVAKRSSLQNSYIMLKVGKNTYHFSAESYKELKEWSALARQVIDYGNIFAANIVEPTTLDSGMVNVQFTSNYIALLCPVREVSIKRWRLDHITSFGQCGGTLTFECCVRCSDPSYNRCSLNIMQEKPATILTLVEKVIRENPNTGEIHYERSILGDIYHCTHQCGGSPRMMPAYSDSNLFRLGASPISVRRNYLESSMPPELHRSSLDMTAFNSNTLESNDSGLPGTPLLDESPRGSSILSSPTSSTGNSGSLSKSCESPPADDRPRTQSDLSRYSRCPTRSSVTPGRESDNGKDVGNFKKVNYSTVVHQPQRHSTTALPGPSSGVTYTILKQDRTSMTPTPTHLAHNRLHPVVEDNPPLPPERKESRFRSSSNSPPSSMSRLPSPPILHKRQVNSFERVKSKAPPPPPKLLHSSTEVSQPANHHHRVPPLLLGDVRFEPLKDPFSDPDELDYDSPPQRGRVATQYAIREFPPSKPRQRTQSQGEMLYDSPRPSPLHSFRAALKSTNSEDDEVADSYQQNALETSFNPIFRLDELEYDETDKEGAMEIMSNLADYRRSAAGSQPHHSYCKPAVIDKVLSKVASDNVKGYAYKITIPVAGPAVVYDVPRRAAPLADTNSLNRNPEAPPKPLRTVSRSVEFLDSYNEADFTEP